MGAQGGDVAWKKGNIQVKQHLHVQCLQTREVLLSRAELMGGGGNITTGEKLTAQFNINTNMKYTMYRQKSQTDGCSWKEVAYTPFAVKPHTLLAACCV